MQVRTLLVQGGLCTRVSKRGTPSKSPYLSAVGLYSMKMVADRHRQQLLNITSTSHKLLRIVIIDDFD